MTITSYRWALGGGEGFDYNYDGRDQFIEEQYS